MINYALEANIPLPDVTSPEALGNLMDRIAENISSIADIDTLDMASEGSSLLGVLLCFSMVDTSTQDDAYRFGARVIEESFKAQGHQVNLASAPRIKSRELTTAVLAYA